METGRTQILHFWSSFDPSLPLNTGRSLRIKMLGPSILVNWIHKMFGPTTFHFCGYYCQTIFLRNFIPVFQVWLHFWGPNLLLWENWVRYADGEFNAESTGTILNTKNNKGKSSFTLFQQYFSKKTINLNFKLFKNAVFFVKYVLWL